MHHLIVLFTLSCLLHAGQSRPSYTEAHSGYASFPVGYHGPAAKTVVLHDGHIADTPEVAAAKHLHYSAVNKAQAEASAHGYSGDGDDGSYRSAGLGGARGSSAGYGSSYGYRDSDSGAGYEHAPVGYHGPLAKTVVLRDGHIADTPEVVAAKHLHYSALGKAQAQAAAHGYSGHGDDGSYRSAGYGGSHGSSAGYSSSYGYSGSDFRTGYASSYKAYSGQLAYPKVLPSGLLADTHEVAAAKQAHWNAVAVTAREHAAKWANNCDH